MDPDRAFECLTDTQRRLLDEFGRRGVRFIVIGGYAVRCYGCPRPVRDLDLVVDCAADNLERIRETLVAWNPSLEVRLQRLMEQIPDGTEDTRQELRAQLELEGDAKIGNAIRRLAIQADLAEGDTKTMAKWSDTEFRCSDFARNYECLVGDGVAVRIGNVQGHVISKPHLIASKREAIALGERREPTKREQDEADLEWLTADSTRVESV